MHVRDLKPEEVEFILDHFWEDTPIRGNCMASGDDYVDEKQARWIESQIKRGNDWAWCRVVVTARWRNFEGTYHLGC